jgi:hypothetical protein
MKSFPFGHGVYSFVRSCSLRFTRHASLFFILFMASCTDKQEQPDYLIASDSLVGIMVDMHLIETASNLKLIGADSLKPNYNQMFEAIFKKHGITKTEFDSTLFFYSKRPDEMSGIYDKVLERLSELDAEASSRPAQNAP